MRILTWNVNVLRTCLDYHPFSSMKKKNVEGLLDELGAQIYCFQEHKTVRSKLEKSMAVPGPYDGFWTFPRSKTGYSGVCTYVDSRYCVPLKAEEGITGLLLEDKSSTMKPPWKEEEKIGGYPEDIEEMNWLDEIDGKEFDPKRLDMEGRAVVCDFGLFVLFNLYCPNETNETRRPYKMNFLHCLQERVRMLRQAGREVIIVGDINIMRAPIDSGEGGIRTSAEQHYEHPARRILDNWIYPKGDMVDVVRESWPDRDDMFTCWNQKLDARSANYGSRIDLILCTPGLRPWIKGGDILNKVYGSDHCPVYIDLHESINHPEKGEIQLKDMLNPSNRTQSTAIIYPNDIPRNTPEPPRFATKFFDEFSGKQTTLKSFFGGGGGGGSSRKTKQDEDASTSPSLTPQPATPAIATTSIVPETIEDKSIKLQNNIPIIPSPVEESMSTPFSLARAAFDSIGAEETDSSQAHSTPRAVVGTPTQSTSSYHRSPSRENAIDMTQFEDEPISSPSNSIAGSSKVKQPVKAKSVKLINAKTATTSGQTKLSSFFSQPPQPTQTKRKSSPAQSPSIQPHSKSAKTSIPSPKPSPSRSPSASFSRQSIPPPSPSFDIGSQEGLTPQEDELIAQALLQAEQDRKAKNDSAKPVWGELFAKKLPPLCAVHQKPCKDFLVMKPGPNKGKRFWLCSLPVGAGYDTGRTKRPREDVNHKFRCDFFLWDSANSRKEKPNENKLS
ncbi:exodeoxyribonuclease III [Kwoniella shivajii]|uniref:DNA-(apurinic or apyrimidinic site) endonuclease n=1 Tax=Kwoniella shivajii TaxID=564305 RepID=A0ABZ1D8M1_9TREE|nr:exodeoxyribonuclease III [Kwoniella shivajii]